MMRRIRVLVVDDSVTIRRMVTDAISAEPDMEVAGIAANGRIALAKVAQVSPDILTLDVEMPEMDGLEALTELRRTHPRLPVLMFSSLTERAASATLEALARGATDYVTKPSGSSGVSGGRERIREGLIPKLRHFGQIQLAGARPAASPPIQRALPAPRTASSGEFRAAGVIAIGCSTGGPNALEQIFSALPANLPAPIVVTQHMPPLFTRLLADRLTAKSQVPAREAAEGMVLRPGQAWIAPGDHHMTFVRDGADVRIVLNQDPPENSCRPAVDVMLRSLASVFGGKVLTAILTGMGQDGLRGCQELDRLGGEIIVQDEETSVVWGMPGFVARAGIADATLPLDRIALEIVRRITRVAGLDRQENNRWPPVYRS